MSSKPLNQGEKNGIKTGKVEQLYLDILEKSSQFSFQQRENKARDDGGIETRQG